MIQKKAQLAAHVVNLEAMDRLACKRLIYTNSYARERHRMWRQNQSRVGHLWVCNDVVDDVQNGN